MILNSCSSKNETKPTLLHQIKVKGKYGFIDNTGKIIIKPEYDYVGDFSEGLAVIEINKKYGFIDSLGNIKIFPEFDYADDFSNGFALIEIDQNRGYINKEGKKIVPPKYKKAFSYENGFAGVRGQTDDSWQILNLTGNEIVKFSLCRKPKYSEGLFLTEVPNVCEIGDISKMMSEKNRFGFIDTTGKWVIQPTYAAASLFSEGLAAVEINGKYGFIDKNGKVIIEPKFDYVNSFHEGLAMFYKYNKTDNSISKLGYIDKQGNMVIDAKFDYASDFKNGFATIGIGDNSYNTPDSYVLRNGVEVSNTKEARYAYGFIDKKGNLISNPIYHIGHPEDMYFDEEELSVVKLDGKYGMINKKGELVISNTFNFLGRFHQGLAVAFIGEKGGFIDKNGKIIIEAKFDDAGYFDEDGIAVVWIGKKKGYVNMIGKIIWEPSE
jgi:hypothetical protein